MRLEDIPEELETLGDKGFLEDRENIREYGFDYDQRAFRPAVWHPVKEFLHEAEANYIQVSDIKENKEIAADKRDIGIFMDQLESEDAVDTWGKRYTTELDIDEQAVEDAATYSFYLNCKDALKKMDRDNKPNNVIRRLEGVSDAYWNELKTEGDGGLFPHTKSDFQTASSNSALIDYAIKSNLIKKSTVDEGYRIRSTEEEVELAETAFENYRS